MGYLLVLFLLNDAVFDLEDDLTVDPVDARRFERLGFDYVVELGCELFSENPMLHRDDPVRARRLAWLKTSSTRFRPSTPAVASARSRPTRPSGTAWPPEARSRGTSAGLKPIPAR